VTHGSLVIGQRRDSLFGGTLLSKTFMIFLTREYADVHTKVRLV